MLFGRPMFTIIGNNGFKFFFKIMIFSWEGKEYELNDITGKPSKVIRSNGMTKLLKMGHQGIVAQYAH